MKNEIALKQIDVQITKKYQEILALKKRAENIKSKINKEQQCK